MIEEAISRYDREKSPEHRDAVLEAIRCRMSEKGQFLIPAAAQEDGRSFALHRVRTGDGKLWLAVFTSPEEYEKGPRATAISFFIDMFLNFCADLQEEGIIVNPRGQSFLLTKDMIHLLLQKTEEERTP